MPEEARKRSSIDLALEVWRRRKWLAMAVFAAPFTAVISMAIFLPKVYEATATVIVEGQKVPEAFVRPMVTGELGPRLQTISEEVLSRGRLSGLVARFGLRSGPPGRVSDEEHVNRMRASIKVEPKQGELPGARRGTIAAFTITYRGSDPRTVALVANTLASFYVEENLRARERHAAGTAEFLRFQLEETKRRLDEQERRVSEFKKRHVGELPQQLQANLATLERLNVQLGLNNTNVVRAMERRDALAKQLAEADAVVPAEGQDAAEARLGRLRQELASLSARFKERYPDVIRLKAEIAGLERQLAEQAESKASREAPVPAGPQVVRLRQALNEVESEITALRAEERQVRSAIAALHQRVENTPRREQEMQELSRDYETMKILYNSLLTRAEEAQLAESMEQRQKGEQFRVLDPAVPPGEPVAPKRLPLIFVGLLFSLGLAAAGAMLAEHLDTSFHTLEEVRAVTAVPVLVSIPPIVTPADRRRRQWRFRLAAGAASVGVCLIVGLSYLVAAGNEQLVWMLTRGRP